MQTYSLVERPDLASAAFAIPYGPNGGDFMQGNLAGLLVRRRRLVTRWPQHITVLVDDDGTCVARGVTVPFSAVGDDRERFPDGGWDQVAVWAVEDELDARTPDTACALEIVVHPDHYGRQLSSLVLASMREHAASAGLALIAPLRPPDKAQEPGTSMADYVARTRPDGLPADRWLRVHVRAGGEVIGVANCSATAQASLPQWRAWTGLPFDEDGPVVVPGALVPVLVSITHDLAVYVEPNVWVNHSPTNATE